jgi:hypothetical protein
MQGSWVLLKMEVNFFSLPSLNETITIETFPSGKEGYFTYRDYLVFDRFHQPASSVWTMMHTGHQDDQMEALSCILTIHRPDFRLSPILRIPDEFGKLICYTENQLPRPEFRLHPIQKSDYHQSD